VKTLTKEEADFLQENLGEPACDDRRATMREIMFALSLQDRGYVYFVDCPKRPDVWQHARVTTLGSLALRLYKISTSLDTVIQ
jgi:hypothetical protein